MRLPTIQGVIDRRILVNYRVDPEVAARLLPEPFQPKLAGGYAIAGVCLIRLKGLRPAFLPLPVGIGSENAAHRFAVAWERDGKRHEGVYVPRRDTSSRLNAFAGGRIFPGEHHHARFEVTETQNESQDYLSVALESADGEVSIQVKGRRTDELAPDSVFDSLTEASAFFEAGSLGYSATRAGDRFDGLELRCRTWTVASLAVESVRSSYFEDRANFPEGSAVFDCALLMRGIEHQWHTREDLTVC